MIFHESKANNSKGTEKMETSPRYFKKKEDKKEREELKQQIMK